jgi:hypothetical protein
MVRGGLRRRQHVRCHHAPTLRWLRWHEPRRRPLGGHRGGGLWQTFLSRRDPRTDNGRRGATCRSSAWLHVPDGLRSQQPEAHTRAHRRLPRRWRPDKINKKLNNVNGMCVQAAGKQKRRSPHHEPESCRACSYGPRPEAGPRPQPSAPFKTVFFHGGRQIKIKYKSNYTHTLVRFPQKGTISAIYFPIHLSHEPKKKGPTGTTTPSSANIELLLGSQALNGLTDAARWFHSRLILFFSRSQPLRAKDKLLFFDNGFRRRRPA